MRKEMIIRRQPDSDKGHALKVAASVSGVESVTVSGESKDMLLVIGDGVDASKLARKLKKEVREAEILELRTLPGTGSTVASPRTSGIPPLPAGACMGAAASSAQQAPPPRAGWPDEHGRQAVGYHHRTPSQGYYHQQSPMVGQGGYGSGYAGGRGYALEVARSHPANYSPMITRHDFRAVGHPSDAGRRREHGGGAGPNCCSIL